MFGAVSSHASIVRILLNKGADVSIVGDDGFTALHLAVQTGNLAVSTLLVEAGADVNLQARNSNGGTALLMSAQKGHLEVMKMLIDAGADLRATTSKGSTTLHLAAEYGHTEVITALLKAGAADPQANTSSGFTPLHMAAQNGHFEIMTALLEAGADPQARALSAFTPLHLATQNGHAKVTSKLLKAGSNLEAKASSAFTPLHLAAQNGHLGVMKVLVKAGAGIEAITSFGTTPLHLAASEGHLEVVRALIDAGANPDTRRPGGETPMFSAAVRGHLETVRALLRANANPLLTANVDQQCRKTDVPLDAAAYSGHTEIVRELVEQVGIEGCGGASGGADALGLASIGQHVDIMAILADAGAVDTGEALRVAVAAAPESTVAVLLRQRERKSSDVPAYVNSRDRSGRTPLYHAVGRCCPRIVRLLVDAGADTASALRVTNTLGGAVVSNKTPLDLATRMLRARKIHGKDAAQEQLHGLEGIRRLLLRVKAVHGVSWLWPNDVPIIGRAPESSSRRKIASTPLGMMLPALRRRARRRVVLLGACAGGW